MEEFVASGYHYGVFVDGELMSCATTYEGAVELAEEYDEDELVEIVYDEDEDFLDILI